MPKLTLIKEVSEDVGVEWSAVFDVVVKASGAEDES